MGLPSDTEIAAVARLRMLARKKFTRTELVMELASSSSIPEMRELHGRVETVLTPELAVEHRYLVHDETWTPAEGVGAPPIALGPHLLEPVTFSAPAPEWAPTAAGVRARGTPTGRRGRDEVATGAIDGQRLRVEAEWEELAVPPPPDEAARFLRFRRHDDELLGRLLLDGNPLVLEERVFLTDRHDEDRPDRTVAYRGATPSEHLVTDLVRARRPAPIARVAKRYPAIGFEVRATNGTDEAQGLTIAAVVFDLETRRGFRVISYTCDEGELARAESPLPPSASSHEPEPEPEPEIGPGVDLTSREPFSYEALLRSTNRKGFAAELARVLTDRLRAARDQRAERRRITQELTTLGYSIRCFDGKPNGWEVWCGDWSGQPRHHKYDLFIEFHLGGADANVEVTVQRRHANP